MHCLTKASGRVQTGFGDRRNDLGQALMNRGESEQAAEELQRAIKLNPAMPSFYGNFARLLGRQGDPQRADELFHSAITCQPDCASAFYERGLLLLEMTAPDLAIADFENAIQLLNDDARLYVALMKCYRAKGNFGQAEYVIQKALKIFPDSPDILREYGVLLQSLGRFEEAASHLSHSFKIQPNGMTSLVLTKVTHSDSSNFIGLIADKNQTPGGRAAAGFALGDVLDKSHRFDEAFAAYAQANSLYKKYANLHGEHFDAWRFQNTVSQTIEMYSSEYFQIRKEFGQKSELPVFVVGMPRSGTSLVEQIVSSHSKVLGLGELPDIAMIRARLAAMNIDSSDYSQQRHWHRHLAKLHLAKLTSAGNQATRVVDKMPANVLHLGLIATMFPNARIILCSRNPMDTCLSCYFQLFEKFNLMFSYGLEDCADQYRQHVRLVEHWKQVLPVQMLEVSYEKTVNDLEGQARRLIEFVGLEWEPACLDFYKSKRPVLTRMPGRSGRIFIKAQLSVGRIMKSTWDRSGP